jgi:multidrug resistance efflux pump
VKKVYKILFIMSAGVFLLTACLGNGNGIDNEKITASGRISADDLDIASEIGGKVLNLNVSEGDYVEAGDVIFRLDDEIVQAQYSQAEAAVEVAKTSVSAARAQLESTQLQYEIVMQSARAQDMEARSSEWRTPQSSEFELPNWYYIKSEKIAAIESEVDAAKADLDVSLSDLLDLLENVSSDDFLNAETRLAEAQATFTNADYVLQRARVSLDRDQIEDIAEEAYDAALAEFEAAQVEYDRLLTTSDAEEILEARAKVAIAQARYDSAKDTLLSYQTGEDSLQVQAAEAGVTQAEVALAQTEAGLAQAEAALAILDIQLSKTEVKSPISGVVLSLNILEGELIASGTTVMTIGTLDEITLTVYIPEDVYGRIALGQDAIVSVDSFPDKSYSGKVTYIADEAEFTPRNVQTTEGRKNTVFAVKVTLQNHELELKPGMPADVTILTQ